MFTQDDHATATLPRRAVSRPARLRSAAAALTALLLAATLTACGGDDDSESDSTTTTVALVIPTTVPLTVAPPGSPDEADAQHASDVVLQQSDVAEAWEAQDDLPDDYAFLPAGAEECDELKPLADPAAMSARAVSARYLNSETLSGLVAYVQVYADEASAEAALSAFEARGSAGCIAEALVATLSTTGDTEVQPFRLTRADLSTPDAVGYAGKLTASVGGSPFVYAFGFAAARSARTVVMVTASGVNPAWTELDAALGAMQGRA